MARDIVKYQHPGNREEQQDSVRTLIDSASGVVFALVADGAGGHSGGRLASEAVASEAEAAFHRHTHPVPDPATLLREVARRGHDAVVSLGAESGISPKTTVAAIYLDGATLHGLHSGDSRIYLFRAGGILRRTIDHSVAQMLVERGIIQESEMGTHPDQGKLTQCLGTGSFAEPDTFSTVLEENDTVLLCSDGVWEHFSGTEMKKIQDYIACHGATGAAKIAMACLDRGRGKADNLSLVFIGSATNEAGTRWARNLLMPALILLSGMITGYLLTRL